MPRIKLTLEYDGTRYVGWQVQPNGPSVQQAVEKALAELFSVPVPVVAAGRTDSGVHALGQVICFDAPRELPPKAYWRGLNGLLPEDISVARAEEVPDGFDPRRWARGKRYRYLISNRRMRSALRQRTHWEIFQPLDLPAMQKAASCLLGRKDFSAFRAADCQAKGAVRELTVASWEMGAAEELAFTVEGTAFLKHMVRNLVGTLVEVGRGRQKVEWVKAVLEGKDRDAAGPTAPAHGLTLVEVFYGDEPGPQGGDREDG